MAATIEKFHAVSGIHHVVPRQTFWDFEEIVSTEHKAGARCRSLSDGVLAELSSFVSDLGSTDGCGDTASEVDSTLEADSFCEISECESEDDSCSRTGTDSCCSRSGTQLWSEVSDDERIEDLSPTRPPVTFIAPAACVVPMMQALVWPVPHCEGQAEALWAQGRPREQAGMAIGMGDCFGGTVQDCRTTLIFKNMCISAMRRDLVALLERHGFGGLADFVYVRTNFKSMTSFGYGVVNFVDHSSAERARVFFHGKASSLIHASAAAGDALEVSWTSERQGLEQHLEHFRNSPLMHPDVPEELRPLVLRKGVPVPMPPPTRRLAAPKEMRRALGGAEQSVPQHA
jgi:hypothetical protein